MDEKELKLRKLLIEGASGFGVNLDDEQIDKFFAYKDVLKEWNQKMNLTAIEDDEEIILKHFIDSISICPIIKDKNLALIDVGTGAGFPGIPVKIVFPELKVKLLDSLEKRTKFLNEVIERLDLKDISTVHARAEEKEWIRITGKSMTYLLQERWPASCFAGVLSSLRKGRRLFYCDEGKQHGRG